MILLQGVKGNPGRPGPNGQVGIGQPGLPVSITQLCIVYECNLSIDYIDFIHASIKGPPGLQGGQGNPGPPGEGLPGEKVSI